jgi:hypothetical protein
MQKSPLGHETLRLAKPSPRALQGLTKTKPPSVSGGGVGGKGKQRKVKGRPKSRLTEGLPNRGSLSLLNKNYERVEYIAFILIQIF